MSKATRLAPKAEPNAKSPGKAIKPTRVSLLLPPDLHQCIVQRAQEDTRSLNVMCQLLLKRGLASNQEAA